MLKTGIVGLLFSVVLVGTTAGQSVSPVNPAVNPAVSPVQTTMAQPAIAGGGSAHPLRLSAGDLLDVKVLGTVDPDFSPKLRVDDSGAITLPYAGRVRVAGRTAEDAALLIEATFRDKDILKDPHVSVSVLEYATQGVTVVGEVKNPGVYPMLGTHSLLDLISAAGGVTPTSGKGVTITHRDDPNHPQIVNIETRPGSTAGFNVDVQPGDTIVVSHAGIIYVMGQVGRPGGFLIENSDRLTILQAISLAQGTNRVAALDKAKLIRKTANGREEIHVPLKKILADKAPDVMLADGDILYVPGSGAKSALVDVESILPSTASAAIFRVP